MVLRRPDGTVTFSSGATADAVDLVASAPGGWLVTSSGASISARDRYDGTVSFTEPTPARVRSLAVWDGSAILAGLDNGDTRMIFPAQEGRQARTLTGTGSPVTALSMLPGGAVMTGTGAGDLRCWPRDPAGRPHLVPAPERRDHRDGRCGALAAGRR